MPPRRAVRIGNVSGATGDAPHAMSRMAHSGHVDVITGDWLSEMNITWNAITKAENPDLGYEEGFLTQLEESLDDIVVKKIKVVTNAGALNTISMSRKVEEMCSRKGYSEVTVASVLGDDITAKLLNHSQAKERFKHLDNEALRLSDWDAELSPSVAVAYIGAWGITKALEEGADIVICGRVTDASPVIGAAAWWHGWTSKSYNELAGALVAGHLIECGSYATGANFSGFKQSMPGLVDLSFPIAEILPSGECFITKQEEFAGTVNKFNITAQLVYELQGTDYLNPDVVADLKNITIEETSQVDRVFVSGITGSPPPPTTKTIIAAPGGYQAETCYYLNGLDVLKKAEMMKAQLDYAFRDSNFCKLTIQLYGSPAENSKSQAAGTVMLRVFAQARKKEDIAADKFKTLLYALRMQSYPGYHMNLDFRTMDPKPFMEIYPSIIDSSEIMQEILVKNKRIPILPATETAAFPTSRPSYETAAPVPLDHFGPVTRAPLGSIVHARSGDKGNNSNVGFFVRHEDEYPWLQAMLTIDRLKELFEDDWTNGGGAYEVERCEFPKIWAVHFRILDFLNGGIASSDRIDGLGKGIGEYLRSKTVDVPNIFLERGRL